MDIRFSVDEKRAALRLLGWIGLAKILEYHRVYGLWPWSVTHCNHCRTDVWPWQRWGNSRFLMGPYGHRRCIIAKEAAMKNHASEWRSLQKRGWS